MRKSLTTLLMNLAMIAVASLLGLAATEAIMRWKFPQPTGLSHQDQYGLAKHWAGITRFLPQFGHEVSFNSAGMRDREHALAKRDGDYRILVMGDSFMEAFQVPFEASLPARLEQTLAVSTGRTIEVINAGVSGWGTDDELRYFSEYGRTYRPDLVVVAMTLHNDFSDNLRQTWHTEREGKLVEQERAPIPWLTYQRLTAQAYIATRLQMYQLWRKARHRGEMKQMGQQLRSHVETLFDVPLGETTGRGVRLTELLLARLDSVVRAEGGRLAVVLLPLEVQLSDTIFSTFAASRSDRATSIAFDQPQRQLHQITSRLGIPVVDLLPSFRAWTASGGERLFVERDGHWNARGHRLATDVVAAALVEQGILP